MPSSLVLYLFISGSFRSISLFLLAFDPIHRAIYHLHTLPASGPHQYLATNSQKNVIYTTSWAQPPTLSCWKLQHQTLSHLNTVPITATSSYIVIPPPFTHIYSVGGPTGEIHAIDPETKGFGSKTQEILFVPKDQLPQADKTRVALRYGSHGIETTSTPDYSLAFVPVLGTNTIEIYSRDPISGLLTHLSSAHSPRGPNNHDGPRHVKVHPNGKILYCVTEHSNVVDLYEIKSTPPYLKPISSRSLLPHHFQMNSINQFRGDTLTLTPSTPKQPSPYALFTTTRGSKTDTRGWLSIFALDENGYFLDDSERFEGGRRKDEKGKGKEVVIRHETSTSGGKANAIDVLPKRKIKVLDSEGVECGCSLSEAESGAGAGGGGGRRLSLFETEAQTRMRWDTHFFSTEASRHKVEVEVEEFDDDDDHDDGDNKNEEDVYDEDEEEEEEEEEKVPRLNFPFHNQKQTSDHNKNKNKNKNKNYNHTHTYQEGEYEDEGVWILLTDDDDTIVNSGLGGGVHVLEWDGWGGKGVRQVASWPDKSNSDSQDVKKKDSLNLGLKGLKLNEKVMEKEEEEEEMKGGSHAIWLV